MLPDDILTRMLGHDWRTTVREGTKMVQQNAERGVVVDGTHIFFAMIKRSTTADKYSKLYSTKQWRTLRGTILTRDHHRCQRRGVSLTSGKSQPTSAGMHHKKPQKGT